MRTISVSTEVFAKIWALREDGEENEDAILKRVLAKPVSLAVAGSATGAEGFYDPRYGVKFPEGFEVFRSYLGQDFRAKAVGGQWILLDGRKASSLNDLSRLIGAKTENAWVNWFWIDVSGQRRRVSELRPPETIVARDKRSTSSSIQTLHKDERYSGVIMNEDNFVEKEILNNHEKVTWRDDVVQALKNLGGKATLESIYKEVYKLRSMSGRSLPPTLDATVRRTLEDHSSDSDNFRNGPDLFYMPDGKGAGVWALRKRSK